MVTLHSTHGLTAIETLTGSKPVLHWQSPADTPTENALVPTDTIYLAVQKKKKKKIRCAAVTMSFFKGFIC